MDSLAIITDPTDRIIPLERVLSAVNHPQIRKIKFYKKGDDASAHRCIMLVGSKCITKYLGTGVAGRSASMFVNGSWYFTLPNMDSLFYKDTAIRAANQIIKAIRCLEDIEWKMPTVEYYTVQDLQELETLCLEISKSKVIAFDFETNNKLNPMEPEFHVTMLGICTVPSFTWVIPDTLLYTSEGAAILSKHIFANTDAVKVAHNASFDMKLLRHLNIRRKGEYACTKIMAHLYDENQNNGLKDLVDRYLPDFSGYDYHTDFNATYESIYPYLAIDCHACLIMYSIFLEKLVEDKDLYIAFRNLYMAGCTVLSNIEYAGCNVDKNLLQSDISRIEELIKRRTEDIQNMPEVIGFVIAKNEMICAKEINDLQARIDAKKLTGTGVAQITKWEQRVSDLKSGKIVMYSEINLGSTKELGELLYTDLGFNFKQPIKDNELSMSTDKDALNDIDHPIGLKMRALRTIEKMLSTYYVGISEKVLDDGKIYASFNQTGTVTGRLSSSNPNLQNIPTRITLDDAEVTEVIKGVKKAFTAPEGYSIIQADLSQAELRIIAHLSKDENMIEAYREGKDLHAITGSRIANMEFEPFLESEKYKPFRTIAKSANFGLVYKISPNGYIAYVKTQTGKAITPADEKVHRKSVFGSYPRLLEWHTEYENLVKKHGFVRTLFGVKRNLPNIKSTDTKKQAEAIRYAINNPVQGTIGAYTVWLMIWMSMRLPSNVYMWSTVHDSILLYCPTDMVEEITEMLKETEHNLPIYNYFKMDPLLVTLKIDVESGPNYGSLK
jgi:DNA polymerase I-like protein with 3'-5' exonuclease and polymerase domains